MKRFYMVGAGALLAASIAASGLMLAGPAGASAQLPARQAAAASCLAARHNYAFPRGQVSYAAGRAGSVTVAPVNAGTIKVARVHRHAGVLHSAGAFRAFCGL